MTKRTELIIQYGAFAIQVLVIRLLPSSLSLPYVLLVAIVAGVVLVTIGPESPTLSPRLNVMVTSVLTASFFHVSPSWHVGGILCSKLLFTLTIAIAIASAQLLLEPSIATLININEPLGSLSDIAYYALGGREFAVLLLTICEGTVFVRLALQTILSTPAHIPFFDNGYIHNIDDDWLRALRIVLLCGTVAGGVIWHKLSKDSKTLQDKALKGFAPAVILGVICGLVYWLAPIWPLFILLGGMAGFSYDRDENERSVFIRSHMAMYSFVWMVGIGASLIVGTTEGLFLAHTFFLSYLATEIFVELALQD